jgi:hypothetical protein
MSGLVGGSVGYQLLRRVDRKVSREDGRAASAYEGRSKLEVLFGAGVWDLLIDKTVVDFGCGIRTGVVDISKYGARRVSGLDIQR